MIASASQLQMIALPLLPRMQKEAGHQQIDVPCQVLMRIALSPCKRHGVQQDQSPLASCPPPRHGPSAQHTPCKRTAAL